MRYETIEIQKEKDVITVYLNRPEFHNAMNEKLMKDLTNFFNDIKLNDEIKIIVLTGKGKSFCSGADLNWMKSMASYSKEENIKDSNLLLDLYNSIFTCPKTIIGKINGHTFGGGIGLLAVCDITIAVPDCIFAFSEVKLGLIPAVISTYILKRVSISNTKRLFITGERFNSVYAKEIGLIDHVYPVNEIDEKINNLIELIRTSGPVAIMEIKNLISIYETINLEKYKEFTVKKIAELRVSKEGQEGINAFLEKRKTKWSEYID